ncbi:MAG: hypothetical protein DDT29_01599 [Dehalococcoidia bacterium]|nr:hypothetical protein [Bacillota bacterium]
MTGIEFNLFRSIISKLGYRCCPDYRQSRHDAKRYSKFCAYDFEFEMVYPLNPVDKRKNTFAARINSKERLRALVEPERYFIYKHNIIDRIFPLVYHNDGSWGCSYSPGISTRLIFLVNSNTLSDKISDRVSKVYNLLFIPLSFYVVDGYCHNSLLVVCKPVILPIHF